MNDQHLLAALLSSPTAVLVGADTAGVINLWSCGAAELYGWSEDEALGQPLSMLVPADAQVSLALRDRLLAGEDVPPFEAVRMCRDGVRVQVELHLVAVRDDDGKPIGSVALHRDLRRVAVAERELGRSREELRLAFDDSPVPQARVDLQGTVLSVNAAMEKLCGEPAAQLVGRNAILMYVETDRPALERALARLASGAEAFLQQERTLVLHDGRHVPTLMTVTTVPAPDGGVLLAGTLEDITELTRARERVRTQSERYEALLAGLPVTVFSYDLDARCTSSRGRGLEVVGLQEDELVGTLLLEAYGSVPTVSSCLLRTLEGKEAAAVVDLTGRVLDCYYRPLHDQDGNVIGGLGIALDITDRATAEREVRANEARMHALLRNAADIVLVVDEQGRLLWASPAIQKVLGLEPTSLFWRPVRELVHPDDVEGLRANWERVLGGAPPEEPATCRLHRADGTARWFDYSFTDLMDDAAVGGMVVNLRDVTDRRAAEHELQRLGLHDPLTGLANRLLLLDRVGQALAWGRQEGTRTGLVLVTVVGMAQVNDDFGHAAGDALLRAVADRLVAVTRGIDSVARVGGDTFAVLAENVGSEEELRARAAAVVDDVHGPLSFGGVELQARLRAGSALSPAKDAGALLSAAERSLAAGGGQAQRVIVAQLSGGQDGVDQHAVAELRRGVGAGQLRLHFQPVMDLATGDMAGAEALVRWQHPQRGLLSPVEFVPLAESSGLISLIGEWVLREACTRAAQWQAEGRSFGVGINLSPRQLVGGEFTDLLRRVVRETGATTNRLVLEVTESAVMDAADAVDVMHELRTLGVKLALDDFGTGYSSLTYLRRFPIDAIKIDRSFVSGLGRNSDDDAIVASVVSLARAVGKVVVAEGVETPGQLAVLRSLGVDQAQGFLWSPGLPAEHLTEWLDDHERRPAPAAVPVAARVEPPQESSGRAVERILQLHLEGASLHTIAAALNAEGLRTEAGPRWTTTTVARVVAAVRPPV